MSRRVRILAVSAALVLAAPASAAQPAGQSWALPQIEAVLSQGLMGAGDPSAFRPQEPLTRAVLAGLVADLTQTAPIPAANPAAPVTMAQLDASLVAALGLSDTARSFTQALRSAAIVPTPRFGTEAVARLLGLRTDHPAAQDNLELLPNDPATRAEAAYSAAQILGFQGSEVPDLQAAAATFALSPLNGWQRRILSTAFSFVGFPYVWGGTSEHAEAPFGVQAHGGFDCSGFVWRVYKLQAYHGEGRLAATLRGRTTYQMSGEVPVSKRIAFAKLQPGDVLFWGDAGARSTPAQVGHAGIYVGNGWFVHSSGHGVALAELTGWYRDRFAWGRRPLAEAGLEPPS